MRDDIDLDRLIPHRPPMRLIEQVAAIDDSSIEGLAQVRDAWPTAHDGQAGSVMLIELIAQTAAVLQGWKERHEEPVGQGGLLVGVQGARLAASAIPIGTHLRCVVHISHGTQGYRVFDGEVRDDTGKVWLSGSIQAFRPETPEPSGDTP